MAKGGGILQEGVARFSGWRVAVGSCLLAALALTLGTATAAWAGEGRAKPGPEVAPGIHLAPASELTSSKAFPRSPRAKQSAPAPRIVGGSPTTIADWPWQTSIGLSADLLPGENGFQRHVCGGTLVAPRIVVSAAHCFFGIVGDESFNNPDFFQAITGRTQLSTNAGQVHDFVDYFVFADDNGFPLYDPGTQEWDVVFILLASPSSQQTIKIAGPQQRAAWAAGREAFITGWGLTSEGGDGSDVLREAKIAMVNDAICGSSRVYGAEFFPQLMVCAGELAGGVDACQGDSGGPLVVPIAGDGHRLVGDTSWGAGCALPDLPGVYGRLADNPIRRALQRGIEEVAGVDVVDSLPNQFSFSGLNRRPRKGTVALVVRVPGPGRVLLHRTGQVRRVARRVRAPAARAPRAASRVRLPVRPRGKARRKLNRAGQARKAARVRVRARVTYTPTAGEPRTKAKRVRLVKRR